jgi:hypothetical protein
MYIRLQFRMSLQKRAGKRLGRQLQSTEKDIFKMYTKGQDILF